MRTLFLFAAVLIAQTATAQLPVSGRYVSMGSSYAAGPGVGHPDPASGACARSMSNYARMVAERRHLSLVDVACSGATTQNILVQGQNGFPAQIESVTSDTNFVSILVGGNDIAYIGNLLGLSCRDAGGTNCHVVGDAEVARRLAALPSELDSVVAEVRRRAPHARIILVGYLPAVPATGGAGCASLPLAAADLHRMRAMEIAMARAIGTAAARNGTGIVRSGMIGKDHDVCSPAPFIAGFHPPRNLGWPSPIAYHPDQAGMDRVAQALDEAIGR